MTYDQIVVLGVLAGALILFVTEWLSVDMVGLLVMVTLIVTDVLSPREAFESFSSEALVTIACMFALSAGLIRVGVLDALIAGMTHVARESKARMVVALILTVTVSSAFLNNTPVAVIFLPVVLGLCAKLEVAPSRLLLPMSYASILGGTCTLIGTSTNLLVAQVAERHDHPPMGIFELTIPGILFAIAGFAYLATVGHWLLPRRATVSTAVAAGRVREFVTEVLFTEASPLIGRSYLEVLGKIKGITPLMLIRGDEVRMGPLVADRRAQFVNAGDVVLLKGDPGAINAVLERDGVSLPPELGELFEKQSAARSVTMVELVINPNSPLIGRTLAGAEFSKRHAGAAVIAILRRDEHLRERISHIRLRLGDTLLVVCDVARLDGLRHTEEFILLEGIDERVVRRDKASLAVAIMAAVVASAALNLLPISVAGLLGVVAMVISGVLPLRHAYAAVDLSILLLISGLLALGLALDRSGLAHMFATSIIDVLEPLGPTAVVAGIYLLAALLTAVVSNNAVAVLLTPIAFDVGVSLGLGAEPFLFAVLFGASASFATPMSYQTNLFVYGPGGYRFTDYMKIGVPLSLLLAIVATLVIPWYWPFEPA